MLKRVAIFILCMLPMAALAQQPPSPPPALVIEPGDAAEFREVVETTIPPRYSAALLRWYMGLLQRQAQAAKAVPPVEPPK